MQAVIQTKLRHIARERHIQILWAIESGSRAWGFASPDSDYDVRAVYVQAPERYLQVDAAEEGFEWIEDEWFDVGAWDLRKTLRLLRGSNAVVLEWLQSPQIYAGDLEFHAQIWALAQRYFQPKNALYHYRGIAKTASAAFQSDGAIRLKKWFSRLDLNMMNSKTFFIHRNYRRRFTYLLRFTQRYHRCASCCVHLYRLLFSLCLLLSSVYTSYT